MAPRPGFIAVCAGVGTVAAAVGGVKEIVKDAKQLLETILRDKCDECGEMVKRSDLETHLQKHRDDEERRKLEEEKKQQEEDRRKLEQNMEELNRKILKIQMEMQEQDLTMHQRELRRQAELEALKSIMEITCGLCGHIVPARLFDAHLNCHGCRVSPISSPPIQLT